jgi:hypothetical protein
MIFMRFFKPRRKSARPSRRSAPGGRKHRSLRLEALEMRKVLATSTASIVASDNSTNEAGDTGIYTITLSPPPTQSGQLMVDFSIYSGASSPHASADDYEVLLPGHL